jgi:hypothetical protein
LNITSTRLTSAAGVSAGVSCARIGLHAIAPPVASTLFMNSRRCMIASPFVQLEAEIAPFAALGFLCARTSHEAQKS